MKVNILLEGFNHILPRPICHKSHIGQTLLHNVVVPGENHRHSVTSHWQTLLHNVVVPGENHRAVTCHWQQVTDKLCYIML